MAVADAPSPVRALPGWVRQALEQAEIDPRTPFAALRARVESLGLEVLEMGEDWSAVPRGRPRCFAAVAAGRGAQTVVAQHRASSGYAEALAWAVAKVLRTA